MSTTADTTILMPEANGNDSNLQSIGFIILEIIINTVMIGEVTTRFLALRNIFWKSLYNIVDIILVMLCVITLILILKGGCLHKGEEIFDLVLLIVRNLVQFSRKKLNRKARNATVDFSNVRESNDSFSDPGEHSIIYDEYDEDFL
ncbi:4221_t:CDS:2 [Diversispora eburnea]|uniref:4221_t:CDS:1 n=1 Tax=Diversispora eburnea TaxID=1213867 RepID=A0A9N8V5C4_9GLOM|nr:4221_t:CDS:2 [Diversispora eburnea]